MRKHHMHRMTVVSQNTCSLYACGCRKSKTFGEIRFRGGQLFSRLLTELCSKSFELLMCVGSPLRIKFGLVGFAFRMTHFVTHTARQIPIDVILNCYKLIIAMEY